MGHDEIIARIANFSYADAKSEWTSTKQRKVSAGILDIGLKRPRGVSASNVIDWLEAAQISHSLKELGPAIKELRAAETRGAFRKGRTPNDDETDFAEQVLQTDALLPQGVSMRLRSARVTAAGPFQAKQSPLSFEAARRRVEDIICRK
jgi:hypothetical protein